MLTKFKMKSRLEKTALLLMLVGLLLTIVWAFIIVPFFYASTPRFTDFLQMSLAILPPIIIIGVTWFYRLFGGLLGLILSVLALALVIISTTDSKLDFFLLAITICYLTGSILAFSSVEIGTPRQAHKKS